MQFILDVEDVLLDLLRGDRRRLVILTLLPVVCYFVMAFEVWLVLWAVGEPIGIMAALTIETFARLGSVASAAIPGNLGALEASNAVPVAMLGLERRRRARPRSPDPIAPLGRVSGSRSIRRSRPDRRPEQLVAPNHR